MTRNNDSDSLKSSIANLVRQNKKRDELINFLMERVETLTSAINTLSLPGPELTHTTAHASNTQIPDQSTQIINNSDKNIETNEKLQNEISLDDVLNSISSAPVANNYQPETAHSEITDNQIHNSQGQQELLVKSEFDSISYQQPNQEIADVISSTSELPAYNHTSGNQFMTNLNLDDVLNSMPTTFKDDDLISTILGADDSASNHGGDGHHDNSNLPPEKLKLLGMNVKQLKQIAKDMNIKSRGNKTELVDCIWQKMSTTLTTISECHASIVSTNTDMDALLNSQHGVDNINHENENTTANNDIAPSTNLLNTAQQLVVEEIPDDI